MASKRKINIQIEKYLGIPTVFVRLHGDAAFGFSFLIDTSVRHNLLDPCFFKEWIVEASPTEEELVAPAFFEDGSINRELLELKSMLAQYPHVTATCQDKGKKRVLCKDGVRRVCNMIKLDFAIEDRNGLEKYSELFAIDPSMCQYFQVRKSKTIVGVLGNDFLKKHKWVLDYSDKK